MHITPQKVSKTWENMIWGSIIKKNKKRRPTELLDQNNLPKKIKIRPPDPG